MHGIFPYNRIIRLSVCASQKLQKSLAFCYATIGFEKLIIFPSFYGGGWGTGVLPGLQNRAFGVVRRRWVRFPHAPAKPCAARDFTIFHPSLTHPFSHPQRPLWGHFGDIQKKEWE